MSTLDLCKRIEAAKRLNFKFDRYIRLHNDRARLSIQIREDQAKLDRFTGEMGEIKSSLPIELQELLRRRGIVVLRI